MLASVEALHNLLILEMDCGMAGAMAGMLLADNGARVVKLEPPGGARDRAHPGHRVWNRGKESVVLGEDGMAGTRSLIAQADVLMLPSQADRTGMLNLALTGLPTLNSRLITCTIGGYGAAGLLAAHAANDALVAARFGLPMLQRGWFSGPSYIAHPLASIGSALLAVQGICAALLARDSSGRGQRIETSLLSGLYAMTAYAAGENVRPIRPEGWKAFGPTPFFSAYECADGRWLQLGCIHRGFAQKAIEAIGIPDVLDDARFGGGFGLPPGELEDELFERVTRTLKTRTFAEWSQRLETADVPFAIVQETDALLDDPQYRVNGIVQVNDPEVGAIEQMGLSIRLSDTPGHVRGPAPRLGQHAEQLNSMLGSEVHQPAGGDDVWSATRSDAPVPEFGRPPLVGIRVLEIANVIAGPMAGRFLADLGAEVVKLESPEGGDIARRNGSPAFLALNAGKQGIAVDLRTPAGQEIGRRLAGRADVVIDNMRPGVAEKLGMGWEQLRTINPRLIYCHATAFGSRGPYAHKPGLDPLAGALSGVQLIQGAYCGKPVYLQVAAVDHATSLLACNGILLALLARARTGYGQRLETSLLDGAAFINSHALARYDGKPPRPDLPRTQYGLHALYRLYQAADGWLCITVESETQWQALCRALGTPEFLADARFVDAFARRQNDDVLAMTLADTFKQRRAGEWVDLLSKAFVPCAPVVNEFLTAFISDPQSVANGLIAAHQHPTLGTVQVAHRWLRFSQTPIQCKAPAPLLGQHTRQVLVALGYTGEEIESLREQQVIGWEGKA